mgnify:CR=1 FL=1
MKQVRLGRKALLVLPVPPAHKALRVSQGQLVLRDLQVRWDLWVPRDLPVKPVLQVPKVPPVPRDLPV